VIRAEYRVTITKTSQGVDLALESAMSGWSGSALGVAHEHAQRNALISKIQAYLASLSAAAPAQQPPGTSFDDPASALARLRDLRDRDLLTEEEYAAKRAEIIARL
jgi:Short C-terminal domain